MSLSYPPAIVQGMMITGRAGGATQARPPPRPLASWRRLPPTAASSRSGHLPECYQFFLHPQLNRRYCSCGALRLPASRSPTRAPQTTRLLQLHNLGSRSRSLQHNRSLDRHAKMGWLNCCCLGADAAQEDKSAASTDALWTPSSGAPLPADRQRGGWRRRGGAPRAPAFGEGALRDDRWAPHYKKHSGGHLQQASLLQTVALAAESGVLQPQMHLCPPRGGKLFFFLSLLAPQPSMHIGRLALTTTHLLPWRLRRLVRPARLRRPAGGRLSLHTCGSRRPC